MTQAMAASLAPGVDVHQRLVSACVDRGIAQFVDMGIERPARIPTHRVADTVLHPQGVRSRTLYLDTAALDGTALGMLGITDSRRLVQSTPFDAPQAITASRVLDLRYPVAVLLSSVLEFFPDHEHCIALLQGLRSVLPPGSLLFATHASPKLVAHAPEWWAGPTRLAPRPHRMFDAMVTRAGFSGLWPGAVAPDQWMPDATSRIEPHADAPLYLTWGWVPPDAA
jgi:S-adenosyl methyltransferase